MDSLDYVSESNAPARVRLGIEEHLRMQDGLQLGLLHVRPGQVIEVSPLP